MMLLGCPLVGCMVSPVVTGWLLKINISFFSNYNNIIMWVYVENILNHRKVERQTF